MSSANSTGPDEHPLRATQRPQFEDGSRGLRLVDLFAGCGGLTLGVAQAARELGLALDVPLALDFEPLALDVYRSNFPKADLHEGPVEDLFDGELGAPLTSAESALLERLQSVTALVGGPPCQGHSNLNNHTRREDPKNALYARMARAAEILQPAFVMVENVPAVQHDKGDVVGIVTRHLDRLGYSVSSRVIRLDRLGVAQTRKRHVLLAVRQDIALPAGQVLNEAIASEADGRDLRWAIGDLAAQEPNGSVFDDPPRASAENQLRLQWLHDNDMYDLPNPLRPKCHQNAHSYKSMYGRLSWESPAQTLTSGYTSIGQGRYGHPSQPRALTAHEAARIQGFPDYYDFSRVSRRTALSTMIGNAVPPALARSIFRQLLRALAATLHDLPGGRVVTPIESRVDVHHHRLAREAS